MIFDQRAGEIFNESYYKIRIAFLQEFESELFARLEAKPNWSVGQIRDVFNDVKDRI
jgi:hypothetical protein